jgi:hypothetical protein
MGANCSTCRNPTKDTDLIIVSRESFGSMDRMKSKTPFELNEEKEKELSLAILSKFNENDIKKVVKIQAFYRKYSFKISESNLEVQKSRAILKSPMNFNNEVMGEKNTEQFEILEHQDIKMENGQPEQIIDDKEEIKIKEYIKNGMDQSSSNFQVELDHPKGDAGADEPRSELLVNSKEPVNSLDNQLRESKANAFDINADELILINNLEDYNAVSHGNRMSEIPEFLEKEEVANSNLTVKSVKSGKTGRSMVSQKTELYFNNNENLENNKSVEIEKSENKNPGSNIVSESNVEADLKPMDNEKTIISLENIEPNKLTKETIIHTPQPQPEPPCITIETTNTQDLQISKSNEFYIDYADNKRSKQSIIVDYIKERNSLLNITNEVDLHIEINKPENLNIVNVNQLDEKFLASSFPNFEEIKAIISPRGIEPFMRNYNENEPKDLNNLLESLNVVMNNHPNLLDHYKYDRSSLEISIPDRVAQSCESFFIRPSYESQTPTPTHLANPFSPANNFNHTYQDHHDHFVNNSEYHDEKNFSIISDVNSITTNKIRRVVRTIVKKVIKVPTTNEKREEYIQGQIRRAVSIMLVLKNKSRRTKFISFRHYFRVWKEEARENITQLNNEAVLKFQKMRESKIKTILKRNFKNNLHSRFYQWYKQILKIRNLIHLGASIIKKNFYSKDKKVAGEFFGRLVNYNKALIQREELIKARENSMNTIISSKMKRSNKKILNHRFKVWVKFVEEEKKLESKSSPDEVKI